MRCAPDQQWSADMLGKVGGSPSEPKPGSGSDKVPTYTKYREDQVRDDYFPKPPEIAGPQVRPAYIYTSDVINNRTSPDCKACSVARRGNSTGYTHTAARRLSSEDIYKNINPERLRRADARRDEAVCRESGNVGEPAQPEEEEMQDDTASADPTADSSWTSASTDATGGWVPEPDRRHRRHDHRHELAPTAQNHRQLHNKRTATQPRGETGRGRTSGQSQAISKYCSRRWIT